MTADVQALVVVFWFRRRSRSVKRTGNGRPISGRTLSDASRSTTKRKPNFIRARSRSSSTKLNSTSGYCCGSRDVERDLAARERFPQHRPEIGDLRAERAPGRLALQVDDQIGLRAARQPRRQAEAGELQAARRLGLARLGTQMRADEQHRDGSADSVRRRAGPRAPRLPTRLQMLRRPDAGAHQQRRRLDAAAAQDDFAGAEFARRARHRGLHADGAPAVEDDLRGDRARQDRQVLAPARRGIEIADRRRGAALRRIAHRQRAIAVAEIAVHVGDEGKLALVARMRGRRAPAASRPRTGCGGSASARRDRAVRRRNRDRSRACGNTAARRSRPSRARRAHPIRRSRRECRATRPFPSRSIRRR